MFRGSGCFWVGWDGMGWVRKEGWSRTLPICRGVLARHHVVSHGRLDWTAIKASPSPEVPCPWLHEIKDSHFPECFGSPWHYSATFTASQSKNTQRLGSKLLGGLPEHSVLSSWCIPWTAREVWRETASFSFMVGLRFSIHRRPPEGRQLPVHGPRGLLSPLLEGKSRLESRNGFNLHIPYSSHSAADSSECWGIGESTQLLWVIESARPWFHPENSTQKIASEAISKVSH